MKIFNSIKELWDTCSKCPICQSKKREICITVGPDTTFTLDDWKKTDSTLHLKSSYKKKQNIYIVEHDIDCLSNDFKVRVTDTPVISGPLLPYKQVTDAYLYFYIQSFCRKCDCSSIHSTDLELDHLSKKVSNIGLERESFWLIREADQFHVTIIYDRDVMLVSRCIVTPDLVYREDGMHIELPLVKLDLSDQAKMVNKLKTLILFS